MSNLLPHLSKAKIEGGILTRPDVHNMLHYHNHHHHHHHHHHHRVFIVLDSTIFLGGKTVQRLESILYRPRIRVKRNTANVSLNCSSVVQGAGRSSEVERSLIVRWVVGSILHGGGPIELFLVPDSALRLV